MHEQLSIVWTIYGQFSNHGQLSIDYGQLSMYGQLSILTMSMMNNKLSMRGLLQNCPYGQFPYHGQLSIVHVHVH